jgi:predicted nucleic acid-binding Zn ribbon protein
MSQDERDDESAHFDPEGPDPSEMDEDDEAGTIDCPYCGKEIAEEAEWCPKCGKYLSQDDAPANTPWWLLIAGAIGILIVLLMLIRK